MSRHGARKLPLAVLALVLLVTTGLAGCIGGQSQTAQDTGPADVEPNVTADNVKNFTNNSTVKVENDTEFDPSSTIHPHDYWDGRESVTLVDGETVQIDWGQWTAECALTASCHQAPKFMVDVPVDPEDPRFVYPGTGQVDVTLTWESEGLEQSARTLLPVVCLSNRAFVPNCETDDLSTNDTHVYESPGETWSISDDGIVNRQTADPPHALKSNWRFLVRPCSDGSPSGQCYPQLVPNVGMTQFTMTVTIHRAPGDLPVDPPHFAFYGEEDQLTVLEGYKVASGAAKGTQQQWMSQNLRNDPLVLWRIGGAQIRAAEGLGQSEQPVIPFETLQVTAQIEWKTDTGGDLELRYRTAADNWDDPWRSVESASSCGDGCIDYTIPVTQEEADSPYALQTQWEFGIFHTGDTPTPMSNYEVTLDITAHR